MARGQQEAALGAMLARRESYLLYCAQYERIALDTRSSLGFWTNPGAEAQFGPSAPRRDLSGEGSARWKQRALYDAMRRWPR
ncbi:MAG: hypothetical protein JWM51_524 [Microbacteriaceae bacterium]|jgi:hypothetical protein|nr:hypothetical protein [Microbacteriaceae bacterium]